MSDTPEVLPEEELPQDEPKLLGDVVGDVLDALGGKTISAAIERITSKPCNCGARKQKLNAVDQAVRQKVRYLINSVQSKQ